MKLTPCPECEEIEPFGDGKGLDQVAVGELVKDKMQPHAAQDADEDGIRVFVDQKAVKDEQLIGMEHQYKLVPSAFITPGCETPYGKMLSRKEKEVYYVVYIEKYPYYQGC